jgi:hypothetical protein
MKKACSTGLGLAAAMMVAVLLGVLNTRAQENPGAQTPFVETDALRLAQTWAAYASQADVAGLDTLLDERYMHIHGTALMESKAQFLQAFRSGARRYDPIVLEDVSVRVFGHTAVVTGKFNLKAFLRDKIIEGVNRFSLVVAATQDRTLIVSFQATPVPVPK